jgi:hypothetical protein
MCKLLKMKGYWLTKDGRMLNTGYALVKLFFRRNSSASATFMSHWCMIVAVPLRSHPPPAHLGPTPASHVVSSHLLAAELCDSFQPATEDGVSRRIRAKPSASLQAPGLRYGIEIAARYQCAILTVQLRLHVHP